MDGQLDYQARTNEILRLAIPTIITQIIFKCQDTVNLIFLGQWEKGDKNLVAGVGLGNLCTTFSGFTVMIGMNCALDTLISQAAGQGNIELCGVYLNRGRFICTLLFVPVCICSFFMESSIIYLGLDPEVASYT